MSGATGQVESLEMDEKLITIPEDMEINIWTGGKVVTEAQHNNNGATPKVVFRAGCITGITARAAKVGALKELVSLLQKSAGSALPCIVTLANGEKWSAPVFGQWDDGSFFNSGDGKTQFALYAIDGYFNQVS